MKTINPASHWAQRTPIHYVLAVIALFVFGVLFWFLGGLEDYRATLLRTDGFGYALRCSGSAAICLGILWPVLDFLLIPIAVFLAKSTRMAICLYVIGCITLLKSFFSLAKWLN